MDKYFDSKGTVGFTCDSCGKELHNCVRDNGVCYCDECYQKIFWGTSKDYKDLWDKLKFFVDKQISDYNSKRNIWGGFFNALIGAEAQTIKNTMELLENGYFICPECGKEEKEYAYHTCKKCYDKNNPLHNVEGD